MSGKRPDSVIFMKLISNDGVSQQDLIQQIQNWQPQSYKSNKVPPPQIFGLVGPPKKRVNRDKLNHWQKLRVMCFNQQFCTKINYFSSIQCFILMYPPPSFTHEKSHPVSCFCLCESHIIRQETDSESRMIQVSTIVVSLHYSESSEESNR